MIRSSIERLTAFRRMLCMLALVAACGTGSLMSPRATWAQTRDQKVRGDKAKFEAEGFWIYADLDKGFAEAKKTNQPLLVVLRCVPCVECVKLDDELVAQDKRLQSLLEKFVRVRVVSTNGLNLSLFQFDTDQSFAVFILNADGTIYGRYGTRSDRTHWTDDVSLEGLSKALEGALELHKNFAANKAALAAKTGPAPEFPTPENYPSLKGKFGSQVNYEGNVVQSCIHCHQVGEAQKHFHRTKTTTIPTTVLFPYPHPKSLGLVLDPKERASVLRAEPDSLAAKAGFQAGDVIEKLDGQPLLSMADIQWVLHHVPESGRVLKADVRRGGKVLSLSLTLPEGWRRLDDIAWRASSWQLRQMGLGGFYSKPLSDEERVEEKAPASGMALKVAHVGQYAPHDAAKRAGMVKGDIVISFNDRKDFQRESDLLAYGLNELKPGSTVPVVVLRQGKEIRLNLTIPK